LTGLVTVPMAQADAHVFRVAERPMTFDVVPGDVQRSSAAALRVLEAVRALQVPRRFDDGAGLVPGSRLAAAMTEAADVHTAAIRHAATAIEQVAGRLDAAAALYVRSDAQAMRGAR
jgi:hypothetical protein